MTYLGGESSMFVIMGSAENLRFLGEVERKFPPSPDPPSCIEIVTFGVTTTKVRFWFDSDFLMSLMPGLLSRIIICVEVVLVAHRQLVFNSLDWKVRLLPYKLVILKPEKSDVRWVKSSTLIPTPQNITFLYKMLNFRAKIQGQGSIWNWYKIVI